MAISFSITKPQNGGTAYIICRLRMIKYGIDYRKRTPLKVYMDEWKNSTKSIPKNKRYRKKNLQLFNILDYIERRLYIVTSGYSKEISKDEFKNEIITSLNIVNSNNSICEKCNTPYSLIDYINRYLSEIENGKRNTNRGTRYAKRTVISIKQFGKLINRYQKKIGSIIKFDEVNIRLYREFIAWMMNEVGLNKNSIGKHIGTFKSIMASAASEGIHSNFIYMNKEFKILKESSDSVYLTRQELNAFKELNLSKYDQCYTIARDLFMIGVYTGQRVSDYTKITKKDITTTTDSEGKRIVYINIIQQKTSKRVSIPCIPQLIDILERYNYSLPQMRADKLNILIKEIARIAGINQLIEIKKDVSGIKKIEYLPKHQLIHSHTARRTFVTLSYMADIDTNDIMKITGHSDTKTLEIYNKSTIVNNESLLNNLHKIFCDI